MERNMVYDDILNEEYNIKDFKGVDIQAHKIENVRESWGHTLEIFCKNGDFYKYKKSDLNVWEMYTKNRWR